LLSKSQKCLSNCHKQEGLKVKGVPTMRASGTGGWIRTAKLAFS
jgi:hypothetical protein